MIRFTVRVYTYDGLSFDIYCGGHTSSGFWYNTFAYMGTQNRSALNVRFTYGGGSVFVYIGELGSSWTYPQVFITDVQVGYTNYDYTNWDDGWVIGFDASTYNNISSTHTVYPPTSSTNNTNAAYASIYYDSNNTGYYLDPASTSNVNAMVSYSYQGNGNVGGTGSASWHPSGIYSAGYNWLYGGINGGSSSGTNFSDLRANIFYDYNNTGYYLDPASTSELNKIYYNSNMVSRNYGIGQVGLYDSYKYQAVFSMGESYILPADGSSTGNLYGIAWSYPNAGGAASNLASHGMLILLNGGFYGAWGGASLRNPGDIRGTIYYDWDNTGYYGDFASTSNLNVLAVQRAYAGYDAGVTGSFSCNAWFRSSDATGWYNATYGGGIYMVDSTYVRVYASKALYVDNTILATNNITAYYSDERLKTNLGAIDNALDKVLSLEGFRYVENDLARSLGYTNEEEQVGLSAQRVQAVLPQAVSLAPFDMQTGEFDGVVTSKSGENYLTVDYSRLVPLLVEAIKELKSELDAVKSRIH